MKIRVKAVASGTSRPMKDSGIKWVGQIPSQWKVEKNKHLFTCNKYLVGKESSTTPLLSLTTQGIKQKSKDDKGGKVPESFDNYQIVQPNQMVMCLFDLDCSAVFSGLSPYDGMISPAYKVLSCKDALIPSYAAYWFQFIFNDRKFMHYSKNLRYTLTYDEFAELPFLLPALEVQKAIVKSLDAKCTCIDSVIEKTRESIEEYKKLKHSIITEAVTKGIRLERPMKDSDVEWIKEIPSNWLMERGKRLFVETNHRSIDGLEELLTVSQYSGVTPRSQKSVNMFEAESLEGYKICEVGDIAANTMWLWAGAIGVSQYNGVISPSYNTYRQKGSLYESTFLDYLLRAVPLVEHYESLSTGIRASRLRLYPQQFLNIRFPVPPMEEQIEIVDYLETKIVEIDKLILMKKRFLSELDDYKRALIYEYVTGKKEVV